MLSIIAWIIANPAKAAKIGLILACVGLVCFGAWKLYDGGFEACTGERDLKEANAEIAQLKADKAQMALYSQNLLKSQDKAKKASQQRKEVLKNVKSQNGPASDYLHDYFNGLQRSLAESGD